MVLRTDVTVVTERGQVSIPAELREQLALGPGKKLLWERVSDHELKATVLDDRKPAGAKAMLGYASRFRATKTRTQTWMKRLRNGER